MDDLISRQMAIDALDGELMITGRTNAEAVRGYVKLVKDRLERLPSAQPEPCEDAVGRDAVVRFLDDWISALDANCHHQSMADLKIVKNDFKNLPSAQPMRKKGKWVIRKAPKGYVDYMMCSNCHTEFVKDDEYYFCPACGCQMMRGDKDEPI